MPNDWSMSVCIAKNVEMELITAPSMMPIIGTTSEDFSVTRRRNPKNTMVPTKANTTATTMRTVSEGSGMK